MNPLLRRAAAAVVAVGVVGVGAGCEAEEAEAPRSGCAALVADAAAAPEIDDQVALLDAALAACPSYDAFAAQLVAVPGLIGYDTRTFVTLRCNELPPSERARTAVCDPIPVPTTVAQVVTTTPELVFVGVTLDGRRIEIRPSDGVEFVGDRPRAIKQNADIAAEAGCEGVIEQRSIWTTDAGDTTLSDRERDLASAYARHAWVVASFTGCDVEEPPAADAASER